MVNLFRWLLNLIMLSLICLASQAHALIEQQNVSTVLTQNNGPPPQYAPNNTGVVSALSAPPINPPPPSYPQTTSNVATNAATVQTAAPPTTVVTGPNGPPPSNTVVTTTHQEGPTVTTKVAPVGASTTVTTAPVPIPESPGTTVTESVSTPQTMTSNQFEVWLQNNGYAAVPTRQPADIQAQGSPVPTPKRPVSASTSTTTTTSKHHRATSVALYKPITYRQSQQAMLNAVPNSLVPSPPDSNEAFTNMLQQNMPMSPQQVVKLHQQIDIAQRAAATPPNIPPKPVSSTIMINLAPGTTPPAVRLALGYVTSLVFVDSTGAPWPIAAFDIGNPKAVSIQWDSKGNILLIQAVTPYSDGNIVIRLVGLQTPITLELVSGQRVVDYRADIHVAGIGPNSVDVPMGTPLPPSASVLLLGVLDGVAPAGSLPLRVLGGDAQAWLLGQEMYLRTRMTVLSPGWVGRMVSPDGMIAYQLPKTSSVLISRYGEPAELKIEGF